MTTTTSIPTTSKDASSAAQTVRAASTRMPSLDQVAARMSSNTSGTNNAPTNLATARPRLPTSLLVRSSSSVASNSNSSVADSTAAQPPTTRSTSPSEPSQRSDSPTNSQKDVADPNVTSETDLTAERLEELNLASSTTSAALLVSNDLTSNVRAGSKPARGYKNVPTLEAITERLRKARVLNVDGIEAPPQAAPEPTQNETQQKRKEHPLQQPWTLYHDTKAKVPYTPQPGDPVTPYVPPSTETGAYEAGLTVIGEFDTVEEFCRYFNWLKPPSRLERNSNYHLFKSGIKPMWEDEANANGGKWVLTMKSQPQLLDRCWSWLAMALVGEELDEDDEICGAVVSLRSKVDRIQLWTRSKDDVERINGLGRRLVKLLDVSEADCIGLEFQYNTDERPTPQKFLSLQASFPQSGFRPTFSPHGTHFGGPAERIRHGGHGDGSTPVEAPGRNPGPFGAGGGGAFGGGWRAKR